MALPGERSKMSLHNFRLPNLKWGSQRQLMCRKPESDGGSDQRLRRRSSPSKFHRRREEKKGVEEEGIDEFREKIMLDLRTMTESMLRKQGFVEEEEEEREAPEREVSPPEAPGTTAEVKPWNLRKRRAACKAPIPETEEEKRVILRKESKKEERPKFLSSLSKKEIDDDFMMMMGHRPPRRPKKRPRTVQKFVNVLHPAYYLPELVTEDIYKIPDTSDTGKR